MIDQWNHCYGAGWSGIITPESFAHPAKISVALADRIYKHAMEQGWVKAGVVNVTPEIRAQIEKEIGDGRYRRL